MPARYRAPKQGARTIAMFFIPRSHALVRPAPRLAAEYTLPNVS
jgi:hypothetical protein